MISGAHQTSEEPVPTGPQGEGRDRRRSDRIASGASAIARIPASPHRVTLIDTQDRPLARWDADQAGQPLLAAKDAAAALWAEAEKFA